MKFKLRLRLAGAVLSIAIRRIKSPRVQNPAEAGDCKWSGCRATHGTLFFEHKINLLHRLFQLYAHAPMTDMQAVNIGNSTGTSVD